MQNKILSLLIETSYQDTNTVELYYKKKHTKTSSKMFTASLFRYAQVTKYRRQHIYVLIKNLTKLNINVNKSKHWV